MTTATDDVDQLDLLDALAEQQALVETVNPRRYSGFWPRAKREGYLSEAVSQEDNRDKRGRNLGKKSKIHRWLGGAA